MKWNLPGRSPTTDYTTSTQLSSTNLADFTVFPIHNNASQAHYEYSNVAGVSTKFTVGGTLVNRLYSWAGAQKWETIQNPGVGAYKQKSYMNVVSRMMQREGKYAL